MTSEQKEAIKGLKEQGYKELYIVDLYTSNKVGCTNMWFIYANIEDAMRWIDLCEQHWTGHVTKNIDNERKYSYKLGTIDIEDRFVITKVA